METGNVWEKIRKTVVDGVTVAAEKTEEYTRMGRAKLDVMVVKRRMTKLQTELGAHIYQAVKDGAADGVFSSEPVRERIEQLRSTEAELLQKEKVYQEFRTGAQADMEEVKKRAKSGMEEIKTKTRTQMDRMKKKAKTEPKKEKASGSSKDAPVE